MGFCYKFNLLKVLSVFFSKLNKIPFLTSIKLTLAVCDEHESDLNGFCTQFQHLGFLKCHTVFDFRRSYHHQTGLLPSRLYPLDTRRTIGQSQDEFSLAFLMNASPFNVITIY